MTQMFQHQSHQIILFHITHTIKTVVTSGALLKKCLDSGNFALINNLQSL